MSTRAHLTHLENAAAAARWLLARLGVVAGASLPLDGPALRSDSRRLVAGDAFIAWPGYAVDGRQFVAGALAAGAAACLVEAEGLELWLETWHAAGCDLSRVGVVPGLKAATGPIAAEVFGHPGEAVRVIGSTGTNGKTSTAWWMAQALTLAGHPCGVIGTLGVGTPPTRVAPQARIEPTGFTTPDPITVQAALRGFADAGTRHCALEATSIGLAEHRLDAVPIEVMLFTNFTPDHLDYHGSMEAYWAAKRAAFDWPGLRAAVLNLDDARGAALAQALCAAGALEVWSYAVQPAQPPVGARHLQAAGLRYTARGLVFEVSEGGVSATVQSGLVGDYNAANLLAVIGGLRALGMDLAAAAALAADFTSVPGRMQRVNDGDDEPLVVVDYAHTPDALDKALQAVRPLAAARGGALVCVFGCGGNRDAGKRPMMGGLAARGADRVIVTSDNPRLEDPQAIVDQILVGTTGASTVQVELDRGLAIERALREAGPRDVVLIAGKGHEDYQDAGGHKRPFSDIAKAQRGLRPVTVQEGQS
jgi:UDP-N-acetylmuramoyl-L-alanyl-D-glutamate--2,6-diaminopimelate ligase